MFTARGRKAIGRQQGEGGDRREGEELGGGFLLDGGKGERRAGSGGEGCERGEGDRREVVGDALVGGGVSLCSRLNRTRMGRSG